MTAINCILNQATRLINCVPNQQTTHSVSYAMGLPNSDTILTPYLKKFGTGNFGGEFFGNEVGTKMVLTGMLDQEDQDLDPINVSGQFSPDAPW